MPYTIVLVPPSDSAIKYVETSQALYRHYQPSYLLSSNAGSFPHITVVQFDCNSSEIAYEVWNRMCDKMEEEKFEPFTPPFTGMSFIEGVGSYKETTWVELSIARGDKTSSISRP